MWTGFDYLGEPTPYNKDLTNLLNFSDPNELEKARKELEELGKIKTPSRSSYFGIVDLCGFPKDRYYNYKITIGVLMCPLCIYCLIGTGKSGLVK